MIILTLNCFFGLAMGLLILGNYICIGYLEGGHLSLVLREKLGFVKVFRLWHFFTTIDYHRRNENLVENLLWSIFPKIVNGFNTLTIFAKKLYRRCSTGF